jgi:hypothetical protein
MAKGKNIKAKGKIKNRVGRSHHTDWTIIYFYRDIKDTLD